MKEGVREEEEGREVEGHDIICVPGEQYHKTTSMKYHQDRLTVRKGRNGIVSSFRSSVIIEVLPPLV